MRPSLPLALALSLSALTPCRAQELTPERARRARRVAHAWLTAGPEPLRADLPWESFARARATLEPCAPAQGGEAVVLRFPSDLDRPPAFFVTVSRDDVVIGYTACDRDLIVPRVVGGRRRDAQAVRDELAARQVLDAPALERRARGFLARIVPDFGRHRFELVSRRRIEQNPVVEHLIWEERAPDGVLAVYPNRIVLTLEPERGQVTLLARTEVRHEVRQAPPVDAARAGALAAAAHPGCALESATLTVIVQEGAPRAVWLVWLRGEDGEDAALVDAATGALRPLGES